MSIIDRSLQVSAGQAITVTAPSTDVIDAGATKATSIGRDIGSGEPLYLEVSVATTMTGAGTLTIALQDSADNSSFADVLALPAIAVAALTAGKTYYLPLPAGMRRYIRANYTITSGPFTGGTLNAQIVDGMNFIRAMPNNLAKVV
jgi:hypothetical protein